MLIEVSTNEKALLIRGLQALKGANVEEVVTIAIEGKTLGKAINEDRLKEINIDTINASCLLDRLMFEYVNEKDLARKVLSECPQ